MYKPTIKLWAKIFIGLIVIAGIFLGYRYQKKITYTNKETTTNNQSNNNQKSNNSENLLEQWASSASASSSYGIIEEEYWSEIKLVGKPDVLEYGDCENAWTPDEENKGEEWIELKYQTPVYTTAVNIYESYNPGTVNKLELTDEKGKYYTVWEGDDTTIGLNSLNIIFEKTNFKTNTVRITLDTKKIPGWNEIDAVVLIGTP